MALLRFADGASGAPFQNYPQTSVAREGGVVQPFRLAVITRFIDSELHQR